MVLGINAGHDSSVCLLRDGWIEYAVEEERLNRVKNFYGWPAQALKSIDPQPVHVALANSSSFWREMQLRDFRYVFRKRGLQIDLINERSLTHDLGSRRIRDAVPEVIHRLESQGFQVQSVTMWDHHLSHAASAYFTGGKSDVLAFTADGSGDHRSASVYRVKDGDFRLLGETRLPHSPGLMYGGMTRYLGFRANRHEGKLSGLSARGDLEGVSIDFMELLAHAPASKSLVNQYLAIALASGSIPSLWLSFSREFVRSLVHRRPFLANEFALKRYLDAREDLSREQYAALAQGALEEAVKSWVGDVCASEGVSDVVFAGGVFSNVLLNQKLSEMDCIQSSWVFPNMGDGGLSVGAAYLAHADLDELDSVALGHAMTDVFLGPEWLDTDLQNILRTYGLAADVVDHPEQVAGQAVAHGRIVGWVQGKVEFGPRALGHRSLLAHPSNPAITHELNDRLGRSDFMPFAPSVLQEYAHSIFPHADSAGLTNAQFMTTTMEVSEEWRRGLAAVVHVDGTARPHFVDRGVNPRFWGLLNTFRRETGIPAVINTSFNMHEEPIVCSVHDAISAYQRCACDLLVIGNHVIGHFSR